MFHIVRPWCSGSIDDVPPVRYYLLETSVYLNVRFDVASRKKLEDLASLFDGSRSSAARALLAALAALPDVPLVSVDVDPDARLSVQVNLTLTPEELLFLKSERHRRLDAWGFPSLKDRELFTGALNTPEILARAEEIQAAGAAYLRLLIPPLRDNLPALTSDGPKTIEEIPRPVPVIRETR